jgi:hypothetical protein
VDGPQFRPVNRTPASAGGLWRPDELDFYGGLSISDAVDAVVNYEQFRYRRRNIGVGLRRRYHPGRVRAVVNITDSRQRWLFG